MLSLRRRRHGGGEDEGVDGYKKPSQLFAWTEDDWRAEFDRRRRRVCRALARPWRDTQML